MKICTHITRLAEWVACLTYEDIPPDVMELARLQMLDMLTAIYTGSRSSGAQKVQKAVMRTVSQGNSTLLPTGEKASLFDAIYLHSAYANAIEYDNIVFIGHVGQSCVVAPMALGELTGADLKDVLVAQVAGAEAAGRMGAYFGTGAQQGHMRAYTHRVAGAIAGSKMLKFGPDKTAIAIAIALSMPEYPLYPASFSPETKIICTSSPTVEGVRSAFLADEGVEAALDIMERPAGLGVYLGNGGFMPDLWKHVEETWVLSTLSSKMFSACAYAQGPVSAAISALNGMKPGMGEIESVEVRAPITTITMEFLSEPHTGGGINSVNTNLSTRRCVASAMLNGDIKGDFFIPGGAFDNLKGDIKILSKKISLKHDWELSINLIRGIDDSLSGPGKPGVYGMSQTHGAFDSYRKDFGADKLFGLKDYFEIMHLPAKDRSYLINRYLKGIRTMLPFFSKNAKENYASYEKDLRKYSIRNAGRVKICLKDGSVLNSECLLPPGFSGDIERSKRIREKFMREMPFFFGADGASSIIDLVLFSDNISIKNVYNAMIPNQKNVEEKLCL